MSQDASSSPPSGSVNPLLGGLATFAAPPPAAAPDEPLRLFDLNKSATLADDYFDEDSAKAAVVAAAAAEEGVKKVPGEGARGKLEAMSDEGRSGTELTRSSQYDGNGEDTDEQLSERAWEKETYVLRKLQTPAASPSPYDCVVQRTNATSPSMKPRGASAASATAATPTAAAGAAAAAAAAADAAPPPHPPPPPPRPLSTAAFPAAAAAAPAALIATNVDVSVTCGSTATALTTAVYKRVGRMASGAAVAATMEDCASLSSWCEATTDVEFTAAPSAAVEAPFAATGVPPAAAVTIFRSSSSTSPNICAVGCIQSNACTAAALLDMSSANHAAAATTVGNPISMVTAKSNDSSQQSLLHPVKYAGEGTCSSSEAQEHALPRASRRGIAARQHLLQRGRIDSILRSTAVAPTASVAAGSGCVVGSVPRTSTAQRPGFATPSLLSGNDLCHSADPLSQAFPQQAPSVPSTFSSRASQKRKNQAKSHARLPSRSVSSSLPYPKANGSCGDAVKMLRSGEASEHRGHPGCTDAVRSCCLTDSFKGYKCRECGKVFDSSQALGGHTTSHVKLRRSNFLSGLGCNSQRQPLSERSSSIRTEPLETPTFSAIHEGDSTSGLLYGTSHASRGSGVGAMPISFVVRLRVESSSNCSTTDILHPPTPSLGPCPGIGSSSSCSRLNQSKKPSAQATGQGRPYPQTSVHVPQGSDSMCLQRSVLTSNNAAAAKNRIVLSDSAAIAFPHAHSPIPPAQSMPDRASHGATAVQQYNPDFRAVICSATPLHVASTAPAAAPLTPSALTAAAWAFMAQQEGDDKHPSQSHMREKSSSPAGAAACTHGDGATCKSCTTLGAAATPHLHARQLGSHHGSDFRTASQTALPLAGIHQQCLQGFLGCKSSQPAVDNDGSEVPAPEGRDNTPILDLNLGL